MPSSTRTFVAIGIPSNRAEKLGRLQSLIAPDMPGARWVETNQFHLTLVFLGDVDDAGLAPVCRAVADAAARFDPFDLRLEALGVFPGPVRPRTVWIGLTGPGLEILGPLQQSVAAAVAEASYPPEDDRFHPHVTLGRLKPRRGDSGDVSPLLRHYQLWSPGSLTVSEVITYASALTPEGPRYMPLARAPLGSRKGAAQA